eukprot:m51a1_g1212 hypothetical protein (93) ;mRNA; f:482092-482452
MHKTCLFVEPLKVSEGRMVAESVFELFEGTGGQRAHPRSGALDAMDLIGFSCAGGLGVFLSTVNMCDEGVFDQVVNDYVQCFWDCNKGTERD